MSRCKYLLFSVLTLGLFMTSADAATCSYEERAKLNNELSHVEANYEILVRRELDDHPPDEILGTPEADDYYMEEEYIQINVLNLTENMYAVITNDFDNTELTYNYSDTNNGNIAIEWDNMMDLAKYTIKIYASNNTNCTDTLLRTIYVSLPRYNDYSSYAQCDKVPDYYLCQKYVTYDKVDFVEFDEKIRAEIAKVEGEETQAEENDTWYEKVGNFISEHKMTFIIGGIVIVAVAGITTTIIVVKRRRRIL